MNNYNRNYNVQECAELAKQKTNRTKYMYTGLLAIVLILSAALLLSVSLYAVPNNTYAAVEDIPPAKGYDSTSQSSPGLYPEGTDLSQFFYFYGSGTSSWAMFKNDLNNYSGNVIGYWGKAAIESSSVVVNSTFILKIRKPGGAWSTIPSNDGWNKVTLAKKGGYEIMFECVQDCDDGVEVHEASASFEFPYTINIYSDMFEGTTTRPTKVGHTFTGWYLDRECTISVSTVEFVTGDIVLYAGFRAHTYKIVYNANGAEGTMADSELTYGTAANLRGNGYTKLGHNFVGWNTASDGSGDSYAANLEVINLTAADKAVITLYAQWELVQVQVTYMSEGVTHGTAMVDYGSGITELPSSPIKANYTFSHWTMPDGTRYSNQALIENTVLTAVFKINQFTITFIVDDAVWDIVTVDYGTELAGVLVQNVNPLLYTVEDEDSLPF